MSGIILVVAVGVSVASFVAFAVHAIAPSSNTSSTEDRLNRHALRQRHRDLPETNDDSLVSLLRSELGDQTGFLEKLTHRMPALSDYLDQADVPLKPSKFIFICVACFLGGNFLCLISPAPLLLAPIVGFILTGLPIGWLALKRKKRLDKFGNQLPGALELLSRSLRAGHSLNAGFGLVATETEAPLAREFGRAFEEQNFGIPLDEAIENMARRIPNMDLRFFATAVILQRQTGGDLAEILDKISHLIRERLQILGQIQALTGEGRMSGAVLLALPPVLFVVMLKLNYEYVMMLFRDPIGRYMLFGGLVTQVIGAIVIKKIITIKV